MKIVIAILVAALVFALLKVLKMGLKRLAVSYPHFQPRYNFFAAFEFIIWTAFIFWSVYYLFHETFFFRYLFYALLFIFIAFLAWFLLRDIFAGIIFKIKHNLQAGSHIRTDNISGYIKSMHFTFIKIKTHDGQLYRIPYSRLNNEILSEVTINEALEESTLKLKIDLSVNRAECEKLILSRILNAPWSNLKEDPSIKFIEKNQEGYIFEVRLYAMNSDHARQIELELDNTPSFRVIS